MTRSPMWNRGEKASATLRLTGPDGFDLAAQFVDGDHAALEEHLGDRVNPALVVAHLVVGFGAEALEIASELVHGDVPPVLMAEQHHQRIDALFPQGVVVLGRLDRTGREPTHVVVSTERIGIGHESIITQKGSTQNTRSRHAISDGGSDTLARFSRSRRPTRRSLSRATTRREARRKISTACWGRSGNVESRYPRSGYKIRVKISGQTFLNGRAKSASVPGFASTKGKNK